MRLATDELELFGRIQERNPAAQTEFVARYYQPLIRRVRRRLPVAEEDAEEIALDVIFCVITQPERYLSSRTETVSALLAHLARNAAVDRKRREHGAMMLELTESQVPADSNSGSFVECAAIVTLVELALEHLSERDQDLAWWCAFGVPPRQVAQWVEQSSNVTRQRMFRLRRLLRRELVSVLMTSNAVLPARIRAVLMQEATR